MQSKRKNISARKSIIGALSNSIGNKSSDAGEALAPSGDSILSVIRNASAHTTGDINQSFLAVYRPLKNLYNSSTVQNRVVENVKKGQLESLKRSIKANALDLQMEKNNGLPTFRPAGRSRFGACCIGQDSILLFGGRFRDTLEASCLWSLKPWWKIAEYKSAKSLYGGNASTASVSGESNSSRDSFYSTESEGYSTDGGYYTSGAEDEDFD